MLGGMLILSWLLPIAALAAVAGALEWPSVASAAEVVTRCGLVALAGLAAGTMARSMRRSSNEHVAPWLP